MHILCVHGVELVERWGSLSKYSQQGNERLHGIDKKVIRNSTNRGGGFSEKPENRSANFQIMRKTYRLRLLRELVAQVRSTSFHLLRSLPRFSPHEGRRARARDC